MGSGDGMARVTYLPGVVPPPSPDRSARDEVAPPETAAASPAQGEASFAPPDFESFFGETAADDAPEPVEPEPVEPEPVEPEVTGAGKSKRREASAENVSMQALTRRGMSRWELEKTLLSREFDEETVTAELDRLEGVGLIDDRLLAETLVRTQHERKGLGRGAITAELRRRHIDQEHIDAALEQLDADDEQYRATELALKRVGQLSPYDLETAKRRLNGFLMRKGYSASVVRAACEEALSSRSGAGGSNGVRFR